MTCWPGVWPMRSSVRDRPRPLVDWNNRDVADSSDARLPGIRLIQADVIGTVAFVATAAAAAVLLRPAVQAPAVGVAGALFVGGCLAFAWGFLTAVQRSRTEAIELSSLFFLKESAPAGVRRALLALIAVQVVAAIVTASVQPYTSLAFGVIAPVWGLGLITLWSGRHGTFPDKGAVSTRRQDASGDGALLPNDLVGPGIAGDDSGERGRN